jgi:hypothetical protein
MKAVLQLTYEHLRYYINTFALKFQICQADEFAPSHVWPADCEAMFDTMDLLSSSPYMDDAVDSAKAYLNILAIYIEPESHLRFMPLRYHLSVFLSFPSRSTNVPKSKRTRFIVFIQGNDQSNCLKSF